MQPQRPFPPSQLSPTARLSCTKPVLHLLLLGPYEPNEALILSLAYEGATVDSVLRECTCPDDEALRVLLSLIDRGLIAVEQPGGTPCLEP